MKKIFCDRCGQEIKEPKIKLRHWTQYKRKLSFYDMEGQVDIEICEDCDKDFREWIEKKGYAITEWL